MALETFTKQPYEEFTIAGEFSAVLEVGETLSTPVVSAMNKKTLADTTTDVTDQGSVVVDGTQVKVLVKAGVTKDTHKITIQTETSNSHKWEIDVLMKVKET